MKNIFAEHDKRVAKEIPEPIKNLQQQTLDSAGWNRRCSNTPGVWDLRPPGHKSITSVVWTGAEGIVHPSNVWPVEWLTSGQMIAELTDVVFRNVDRGDFLVSKLAVPRLLEYFTDSIPHPEPWIEQVVTALQQLRQIYPEYSMPWSPPLPEVRMYSRPRPGWEDTLPDHGSSSIPIDWHVNRSNI